MRAGQVRTSRRRSGSTEEVRLRRAAAVTISWYLTAAIAVAVLAAQLSGVPPAPAVGLGLAATVAVVGIRIAMEVRRQLRRQQTALRNVVSDAGNELAEAARSARTQRERVDLLITQGRLADALAHAEPLVAESRGDNPGWGVAEAACGSTVALATAFIARGDEQAATTRIEVLVDLTARRDLGVAASITTLAAMRRTIDAMLQRRWWGLATRALDVIVAAHRSSLGLDVVRDAAIARVLLALMDAREPGIARDVHRRYVVGARPPVQLEPPLAARVTGELLPP